MSIEISKCWCDMNPLFQMIETPLMPLIMLSSSWFTQTDSPLFMVATPEASHVCSHLFLVGTPITLASLRVEQMGSYGAVLHLTMIVTACTHSVPERTVSASQSFFLYAS